jgi:subtilisin family serine protease
MCEERPLVQIGVFAHEGEYLENAQVRLEPEETGREVHYLQWERSRGCHLAAGVSAGGYRLIADAPGLDPTKRRVEVDAAGLRTVIVLGSEKLPSFYRGQVQVPFRPQPDLLAIALDDDAPDDATLDAIVKPNIFLDQYGQRPRHARVFRFPPETPAAARAEITEKLIAVRGVHRLGPVVHFDSNESISCLTDELVVRFRPEVTPAQIDELAKHRGLAMRRKLVVAENMFVFGMPGEVSYDMLAIANEVARSDLIVYAEPNLVSIGIHDAIGGATHSSAVEPTDFLFPMQWHLALMRCPQAWRLMHDCVSPHHAMGSPGITIAVVDWGIDVDHPEFAGKLADGEAKVSAVFDFHNIAANNHGRWHGHGTCCAGVATALPNNEGGCGVAGNCSLMAIRRPEGIMASETAYSDMYLWIAGIDPECTANKLPKPPRPGADVISNSFGYAAGLPISGLMQDTFTLLTDRGREGRGVLLFFSTGNNDPPVDFTLLRPWAAHVRTLAVAASTLAAGGMAEGRAKQSNYGGTAVLDFCAPSATALGADHDPPRTYAIVTAADRCSSDSDPNLQANAPSDCQFRTTTSTEAARGDAALEVISGTKFYDHRSVLVGTPGTWGAEFSRIKRIPTGDTRLELEQPLKNRHARGTAVCAGPAASLHSFSGTSCATALAAGVGALLLSACPELSWDEARDILRRTAVKIDAASADATGVWRDADGVLFGNPGYAGPHYSRGYGFGRIDAFLAVKATLVRNSF